MDIKILQDKKEAVKARMELAELNRQKGIKLVQESVNELIKLTGAYEQLSELEKELTDNLEKK